MGGKPVGIVLLLLACGGCHACQNCCDYSSPVADGPYSVPGQRAGSAFGGHLDPRSVPEPEYYGQESSTETSIDAPINLTSQELMEIDH
jgi:hypothetical protein